MINDDIRDYLKSVNYTMTKEEADNYVNNVMNGKLCHKVFNSVTSDYIIWALNGEQFTFHVEDIKG